MKPVHPSKIKTVGVLGTGTIGASWAALFLAQNRHVKAWDPKPNAFFELKAFIQNVWPDLEQLNLVLNGASVDNLTFCNTPHEVVTNSDFVQENVPERLDIKVHLYTAIEPFMTPESILSTSTSGLLISDLQGGLEHPERLVLGHPFNPPHLIPLVEVLGGQKTAPEVVQSTIEFYNSIGKTAIKVRKEVPGHVANRLQAAIWREAVSLVVEGVASLEDVDAAIEHGPGLRWALMGPHLTFHLAGGAGGLANFLEHFGTPMSKWWDDLGRPELNKKTKATLLKGIGSRTRGADVKKLSYMRDKGLIEILKLLQTEKRIS
jgi:3-hydroxyacyl-CoA dehydrogenase